MRITKVEYLCDYQLKLTFSNKEVRVVDLSEKVKHARGVFLPLKDLEYFKKVDVDDCQLSICWPNGADICPDVLYAMEQPAQIKKSICKKPTRREHASKQATHRSKTKTKVRP
ncbi:MAG: hypothetical protein HW387_49 [Parachlamydiales bacterium]|nr:hypothetical protein [Parachlamydiales bacterium]